jgi:hypothetical protein
VKERIRRDGIGTERMLMVQTLSLPLDMVISHDRMIDSAQRLSKKVRLSRGSRSWDLAGEPTLSDAVMRTLERSLSSSAEPAEARHIAEQAGREYWKAVRRLGRSIGTSLNYLML